MVPGGGGESVFVEGDGTLVSSTEGRRLDPESKASVSVSTRRETSGTRILIL